MLLMNNLFVLLKEKQQHNIGFPTLQLLATTNIFFIYDIFFSIYFIFMTFLFIFLKFVLYLHLWHFFKN